jgi:mono/diheme cytochrome c family protein
MHSVPHTGFVILLLAFFTTACWAEDRPPEVEERSQPSVEFGAVVFQQRCVLCHGNKGMGEGLMPLSMKGYPSTNLFEARYGKAAKDIREVVLWGGKKGLMSPLSPPWGDELTWREIESVVLFVQHLHSDRESAISLLKQKTDAAPPSKKIGQMVFRTRCVLCHGPYGEGDGKMARIINAPPPFNLTKSKAPDDYLRLIIGKGGASAGRSPKMPPWGDELSRSELESVISFIKTLRD